MRYPTRGESVKHYMQYVADRGKQAFNEYKDEVYAGVVEPALHARGGPFGRAAGPALDAYGAAVDIAKPGYSAKTKISRGLEGVGRAGLTAATTIAGGALGGLAGPAAPIAVPAGAAAGGLIGYKAPEYIRDKVAPSYKFPSEQMADKPIAP